MKTEHWRKFLESLEGEKGLPEEMHGWRFDMPMGKWHTDAFFAFQMKTKSAADIIEYLEKRVKRAESRQIPDLKEKVKAFVLDAMNVEDDYAKECLRTAPEASPHAKLKVCDAFRALCAPDKGQEVTT